MAYLDVGAGGYLDLGSELSEDALQQLPKGRHALVIAGTYGIDGYVAAPQPSPAAHDVAHLDGRMRAAQQPVACEPLIHQMRNALSLPCDRWNATQSRIVREAIKAADAWLEGKA